MVCGSTAELDDCGVCDGDNSSCEDCAGVPNGDAELDDCGICNGSGPEYECWDGEIVCDAADCSTELFNYPDWSFDGALYENQASITGDVSLDGEAVVISEGDLLAAFVDDDIRGLQDATYCPSEVCGGDGAYIFLIQIYSIAVSGEAMSFKYYTTSSLLE
jgi:hypothetical protein